MMQSVDERSNRNMKFVMNGEQLLPINLCHLMNETSQRTRDDVMGAREIFKRRHMLSSEKNVQASPSIRSTAQFNLNLNTSILIFFCKMSIDWALRTHLNFDQSMFQQIFVFIIHFAVE